MIIEHRWSHRKHISLDIHLYYPPVGTVHGKTRNISLEGMFVELKGITIPPQTRLEVAFATEAGEQRVEYRLLANVIHSRDGGVGLMLQHAGQGTLDALRYVLNAV